MSNRLPTIRDGDVISASYLNTLNFRTQNILGLPGISYSKGQGNYSEDNSIRLYQTTEEFVDGEGKGVLVSFDKDSGLYIPRETPDVKLFALNGATYETGTLVFVYCNPQSGRDEIISSSGDSSNPDESPCGCPSFVEPAGEDGLPFTFMCKDPFTGESITFTRDDPEEEDPEDYAQYAAPDGEVDCPDPEIS